MLLSVPPPPSREPRWNAGRQDASSRPASCPLPCTPSSLNTKALMFGVSLSGMKSPSTGRPAAARSARLSNTESCSSQGPARSKTNLVNAERDKINAGRCLVCQPLQAAQSDGLNELTVADQAAERGEKAGTPAATVAARKSARVVALVAMRAPALGSPLADVETFAPWQPPLAYFLWALRYVAKSVAQACCTAMWEFAAVLGERCATKTA